MAGKAVTMVYSNYVSHTASSQVPWKLVQILYIVELYLQSRTTEGMPQGLEAEREEKVNVFTRTDQVML